MFERVRLDETRLPSTAVRSRRDAGDRFRLNAQPLVGFGTTPPNRRYQRLQHALRRRRRLRNGLIQLLYMVPAVGLAFLMSAIDAGPDVDGGQVISLFFSLAGGLIAFIALVFSLLFLVVPYANTTLTPRLTLFRDDPVVWHSFAFFAALFVFLSTTGMVLNHDDEISFVVPVTALVLVLVSLGMVRALPPAARRQSIAALTSADSG